MALSDLAVFNEYAYSSMTETLAQQVELFNAATRGGLVLASASHQGDYSESVMWQKIAGLVRRRDAYGAGAVGEKVLKQIIDTMVKVAAGTPPVRIDPSMMKWIQRSPAEAGATIGQQLAGDTLADMLNAAIMVYKAAVGGVADLVYDFSADPTGTPTLSVLNQGAAKFGDRADDILCWVMHSKSLFDIYGVALANKEFLFTFGNVKVVSDGFGRPFVVTDSTKLIVGGPPVTYGILGLSQAAVVVHQNNDFTQNIETKNGAENIVSTYQAEWSYNLGIKGFAWDKTHGGHSPTDASLATGTNWDQYVTSVKDAAGVLVIVK